MSSWQCFTNARPAIQNRLSRSYGKSSMNCGAQFKWATLLRGHIMRLRRRLIIAWSGWNGRARNHSWMAWRGELRINGEWDGGRTQTGIRNPGEHSGCRHLGMTEDLRDSRRSPRTESLVGSAVQSAER